MKNDEAAHGRPAAETPAGIESLGGFDTTQEIQGIAWSPDGRTLAVTFDHGGAVALWSTTGDQPPRMLRGHKASKAVMGVAWHPGGTELATASDDTTVRIWNPANGSGRLVCQVGSRAKGVAWSPEGHLLAVTDDSGAIGVWDAASGDRLRHARVADVLLRNPCWSPDGELVITCANDGTIGVLRSRDLEPLYRLNEHSGRAVLFVAVSPSGDRIASASNDGTVGVWDMARRTLVAKLECTRYVNGVRFSPRGDFIASGSADEVRLWRCKDWACVAVIPRRRFDGRGGLDIHPREPIRVAVADRDAKRVECYLFAHDLLHGTRSLSDSRRYVNAKVVLVGDSGVGKSGLALVLSGQPYQATDSTHNRNVCVFDSREVETSDGGSETREVLVWDLAGQPGYRLVHQLHLNEVAVALVVFDSRSETDPFAGVKHWVRALAQARRLEADAAIPIRIYLVAGPRRPERRRRQPGTTPGRPRRAWPRWLLRDQRPGGLAGHGPRPGHPKRHRVGRAAHRQLHSAVRGDQAVPARREAARTAPGHGRRPVPRLQLGGPSGRDES